VRAIELIGRAIVLHPGVAPYYANLAEAYRALGQFDRAVDCCRAALRLQPEHAEAANNLGLALLTQGKHAEAVTSLREAVRLRPDMAMLHNNLANALRAGGDVEAAIAEFRDALRLDPALAEAHSNLGQLLLERLKRDDALAHCREAVRLRPGFAEAQNNLANALREVGRLAEAKACYAEALRLNPDLALTYNNIGQALQEEGLLEQALRWYEEALRREPNAARIHCNLASLLEEEERYDEARARYALALGFDPDCPEAHNGIGFLLHEQGRFREAAECYRHALALRPDFTAARCNLGRVHEELSAFDEAERCFREVLRIAPEHTGARAQLAILRRDKLPEEDLEALRKVVAASWLSDDKRAVVQYGLAHALDARGAYDEAAEYMRQANALAKAGWEKRGKHYDPAAHTQVVDSLIEVFTPTYFKQMRGGVSDSELPVFVFGLPRSGTTLVEQVLASHSQVHGAGELRFVHDLFEALPSTLGLADPPAACAARLDRPTIERLASAHLDRLREFDSRALRITDKMPDNYLYLGLIATLFPSAALIHCRRELRDVAVSCWLTNFRHIRWACDPSHIAARFRDYSRLMEHWRRVLPVPLLEVDYEETVTDLEGVARRLVAHCGLAWELACLAFHENRRPIRTASVTQVRQPVYQRSVARWKHYEQALAPLFAGL
jgi:tetratricopeptide (TPR) repeat protein